MAAEQDGQQQVVSPRPESGRGRGSERRREGEEVKLATSSPLFRRMKDAKQLFKRQVGFLSVVTSLCLNGTETRVRQKGVGAQRAECNLARGMHRDTA